MKFYLLSLYLFIIVFSETEAKHKNRRFKIPRKYKDCSSESVNMRSVNGPVRVHIQTFFIKKKNGEVYKLYLKSQCQLSFLNIINQNVPMSAGQNIIIENRNMVSLRG